MPTRDGQKDGGGGASSGDITAVTVTSGGLLSGGGASGAVNIASKFDNNLTWTGVHTFNPGTTPGTPILLDMAQPGSAGQRDSHAIQLRGTAFDTTGHNADWLLFADVTSNAGVSKLVVQNRKDAAAFATLLSITDTGIVTATSLVGGNVTDSALTSGRVVLAGVAGLLGDASTLTFSAGTLSATAIQATGLTSGRVPVVSTGGLLVDDADLTFAVDTLTATKLVGTTSVSTATLTASSLTSGRIPIVSTAGLFVDDADLTFAVDTLTATKIVGTTSIVTAALTASGLTSGRLAFASTGGLLVDDADLTFAVDTLTATKFVGTTSVTTAALTVSGLTAGRVPIVSTAGLIADDADLTFTTDTLTATKFVGTTSVSTAALTVSGLTSGRVPIVSTAGLIADDAELLYNSTTNVLTAGGIQNTALTSGRVALVSTAGLMADDSALTYGSSTLTAPQLVTSSSSLPLQVTITDGSAATQIEGARLRHLSSIAGTAGIGVYQSFWASNGVSGGATLAEAVRIKGMLRTVTNGAESGSLEFLVNQANSMTQVGYAVNTGLFGVGVIGVGTLSALGASTSTMTISSSSFMIAYNNAVATLGGHQFTGTVNTTLAKAFFVTTPSANTGITTTAERATHVFGSTQASGTPSLTSIIQTWANGTVALQRENIWVAPTYLQTSGTNVMTVACHHDFGSIPQITGTTNSITGARIARFGGSVAQGVTAAATTYVGIELVPSTITYTGSTQVTSTVAASQLRLDILTLTDASAVTIDQAATLDIVGAVAQAGSVTITKKLALLVRAGDAKFGGNIGFYNTDPVAKPTVTGSRGSNAAVTSLLTGLSSQGLITDNTTA
jgi:hypothetical protein